MSEKQDGKNEKGLLARTATYTSKKARRAQTKLKQRVGKGDETKDEVFDEFVFNFNKQQASATRLHAELKNYMRCITAMQVAHTNFGEAVKEVYESDWSCRPKMVDYFNEYDSNWTKLRHRVLEEVLEPLTSYLKPFPDVKTKISKRARKLVDYDHSRHAVDTLRAKGANKSSETKKLHQTEDEYQKAKDVFIDLTSELYEELPALYDSRIGFYVSCFQSIFTLEEVFHREASDLNHSLNDLMDQLITDFSAGTFSTRKPFSAGIESSLNVSEKEKDDTKLSSGSLAQFYDVAVPDDEGELNSSTEPQQQQQQQHISPLAKDETDASHEPPQDTTTDHPSQNADDEHNIEHEEHSSDTPSPPPPADVPSQPTRPAPTPPLTSSPSRPKQPELFTVDNEETDDTCEEEDETDINEQDADEVNVVADPPSLSHEESSQEENPPSLLVSDESVPTEIPSSATRTDVVAYKNNPSPENPCNLVVPNAIYKVIATHKYNPEDEDELSFEKGEIVHVIPYEDPEEQDDGWLMGVMDSNGFVGVFPENFSKRLSTS